jgi:4-amino-4-deoxy-L-arabinose transferase-like glycosyltransferase
MSDHSKVYAPRLAALSKRPLVSITQLFGLADSGWCIGVVLLIAAATFAARAAALFTTSIDADEGVYLVMAQQWQQGGLPYVAVWDQHPPGLPALLSVVLRFVFDPVLGARLAAAAAVAATAVLIHRFCQRHAHNAPAGLLAALLYVVCISRWAGLSANTEIFNNLCVTFAAYHLVAAAREPHDRPWAVMAAFALGVGLQIKYVVFPEAVLMCLGYLLASYRRDRDPGRCAADAALMVLAGCLPTALVVAYFWSAGALQAFLQANIGANVTYVGLVPSLRDIIRDSASGVLPIVGPVLIIGYAIWHEVPWRRRRRRDSFVQAWMLLWIIAAALDVCLPMKFFRHYFFALYPPICMSAALALDALTAGSRKRFAYGLVVLLATAAPAWLMGVVRASPWSGEDVPRTIAQVVRQAGGRNGDLYVYRYQPTVYALARLRPPTPYVMTLELSEFSESAHVDGTAEVNRIMQARPRFVVKPEGTLSGRAAAVDEEVTRSLAHYRLVRRFNDRADRSVIGLYER